MVKDTQMGKPLESLFHALWQEVALLHREWHEYVTLFGTKQSRITLLNKTAPVFFRLIQDSLFRGTLLHIARLTDPSESFRKQNLTIQALACLISDPNTAKKVDNLTQKAVEAAKFCRDWRNRRIAHRDLNLALSTGAKPLEPASREKVKLALDSIAEVLNAISSHYKESTTFFGGPEKPPGGAASLLYVLDDGIRAAAEREERIRRGDIRSGDFSTHDI